MKIRVIVLAAFLIMFLYSLLVPPFEASDEKWHYPLVAYIADHWTLPVQQPGVETPWRQEGSQPPLYYFLAALATAWMDTSDLPTVRHLNPYVNPGATLDGNINLVVHNPTLERFPWHGTILSLHLVRTLSALMSAIAVYLTYLIVAEIFPDRPLLALGTAAVHAFTPMYIFISASVNNDNLAVLLCNLTLLILLRIVNGKWSGNGKYLLLGLVLGLTALTKSSALPLTVLTALIIGLRAIRYRSWREFLIGGVVTLGLFLLVSGRWFWRNWMLYGDPLGLNVFIAILGKRDVPADLAQLWRERYSFLAGYWGNFGGLNVPMPSWVYTSLNTLLLIAAAGLLIRLLRFLRRRRTTPHIWPLTFLIIWGLGVFISWSRWASITWSSQGRLVFPAIQTWSLLLMLGLTAWVPQRHEKWVVAILPLYLLLLSIAAPFLWIRPAYTLPATLTEEQVTAIPNPLTAEFDHLMRLLGYDLESEAIYPGDEVPVTLYWEALAPSDRDYTVFVHLLGAGDLTVAQRDTFPGLGLLSTTWLQPGYRWADRYILPVPETAYAPDTAQIEIGLYDATTGRRLRSGDRDNIRFGQITIRSLPGDYPNPISVNFGGMMELIGYDIGGRILRPGDVVTVTLYWRGRRRIDTDYTVSVQLVDRGQNKAAQHDGQPQGGTAPTTTWKPGVVIEDPHRLIIGEASPGVYDLRVVVYVQHEGKFVHLPVISPKGEMLFNYRTLTGVRVE